MGEPRGQVLVYDRVDANRRNTFLFLALFTVISLPAVAYIAAYLVLCVAMMVAMALSIAGSNDQLRQNGWTLVIVLAAVISLGIVLVVAYLQYNFAAAAVLRLSGAREIEPGGEPQLERTVENLCIGSGLPHPGLYLMESEAANAFSTGMDPDRASLVVTRGMLKLLDRGELEGVLAYELAQIGNYDTRLGTVLAMTVGILRLPIAIVVGIIRFLFRIHWLVGTAVLLYVFLPAIGGFPFAVDVVFELLHDDPVTGVIFFLAALLPLYVFFAAPLIGDGIRSVTLRERVFLADADAVLLTRNGEGLVRALAKIGATAGVPMKVAPAMAHLYFVDPLSQGVPRWDRVFATHPSVEERIAALSAMGGGVPPSLVEAAAADGERYRSESRLNIPADQAPPPDGWHGQAELAAAEDDRSLRLAFRLSADTPLYAAPDRASTRLAKLPEGTLVTVSETDGDFFAVLTDDDSFGYIPRSAAMLRVDLESAC